MGKAVKDILKSTAISIGMAHTIFSLVGMFFDIVNGGNFSMEGYRFTKMVVGSAIVGIGFGVPTVVYNSEKLPMPVKVLTDPHGNRMCHLYHRSIRRRLVRRRGNTCSGTGYCRNTAVSGICYLVLLHALLQKRSKADE